MKNFQFLLKKKDLEYLNSCPLCNNKNLKKISEIKNKELIFLVNSFCKNCNLIFKSLRPNLKWFLKSFRAREEFQKENRINPINQGIEKIRKFRYLKIGNFLKRYIKIPKLLDMGTGTGLGLLAFKKLNFNCEGLEPDISRSKIGRSKGLRIHNTEIEKFKSKKKFDIITFIHSFEHLHNMRLALLKAIKLLKDGGYIYIEVPDLAFKNFGVHENLYLAHIYNFSEYSLVYLKNKFNLVPISRFYSDIDNSNYSIAILFQKKRKKNDTFNNQIKKFNYSHVKSKFFPKKLINLNYLKFEVPKINDLSMTYKSSSLVYEKLFDNYKQKKIIIDDNKTIKTLEIKKIKKIKKNKKSKINYKKLKKQSKIVIERKYI
jgi:SAM-dependent methyltransferase